MATTPKTVAFYTLGCKLNFSETATIAQQFTKRGFEEIPFEAGADVYVINTCSVTEEADKKCRKIVKQALKKNPFAKIIVTGCYAQLKPQTIAQIPGVYAVLGAAEKFKVFELFPGFDHSEHPLIHRCEINDALTFETSFSLRERTRSFLKVQDGCSYNCSFCTIPLARGKSRSDSPDRILQNIEEIISSGIKEIVLTGINLGDFLYQTDNKSNHKFIDLLRRIEQQSYIGVRFRLSSIEPNLLHEEIIALVAESKVFMPHFHIPLQSGSNKILGLMRRRYKAELYQNRVELINKWIPDAGIGCDVITGFPSEGEIEFEETFNLIHQLPITYLHVFPYSERENTYATQLNPVIAPSVRAERAERLRTLSEKKKFAFNQLNFGKYRNVLVENQLNNGFFEGLTDNYIRVLIPMVDNLATNTIVKVKLAWEDGVMIGKVSESSLIAVQNSI